MKLTYTKLTASQAWILLGYALCLLCTFTSQHHTPRKIVTGMAAGVLVFVTARLAYMRTQGRCTR